MNKLPRLQESFAQLALNPEIVPGIDIVMVADIQRSLDEFGEKFLQRIFTAEEIQYAEAAPALRTERLAARFAAKEACRKVLRLDNTGIGWRAFEVRKEASGACSLRLHAEALDYAEREGFKNWAISLSHEADYAAALVIAECNKSDRRKK